MSEVFTARLVSLSAAHDILTRENWEGAGLRELAQVALGAFDERRIRMSGPEVRLGARAAIALSMSPSPKPMSSTLIRERAPSALPRNASVGRCASVTRFTRARSASTAR